MSSLDGIIMSSLDDDGDARSPSKPILRNWKLSATIGDPGRVLRGRKSRQCAKGASSSSNKGSGAPPVQLAYDSGCLHPWKPSPLHKESALLGFAPRVQLIHNMGCLNEWISGRCAKAALTSFNKKRRAQKEPQYELVKALQCIRFKRKLIFHSNFVARPKNGSDCENKLFFAEVKQEPKVCRGGAERYYRTCSFCCILEEPSDSRREARPSGCISCDRHPGCVQHPPNMDCLDGVEH